MFIYVLVLSLLQSILANLVVTSFPTSTQQCQAISVAVSGGVPPLRVVIVPIYDMPIIYSFNPSISSYGTSGTNLVFPLALASGSKYSVIFSDSTTYSSSVLNPTVLQYVGTSTNTSCLPSTEQAMATFEFSLGGSTAQCSKDFEVSWSGASSSGPYSVTFVPIDGSYVPYEIPLPANVNAARVQVPFAAGTRFTVLVTDRVGQFGDGGVGGIYQVAASSDTSCLIGTPRGVYSLPAGVTTNTIMVGTMTSSSVASAITLPISSVISSPYQSMTPVPPVPTPSSQTSSSLSTAAIGGIAAGGGVAGIAVIMLFVFYYRRKRNVRDQRDAYCVGDSGYADNMGGDTEAITADNKPTISPYSALYPGTVNYTDYPSVNGSIYASSEGQPRPFPVPSANAGERDVEAPPFYKKQ